MEKLQLKIKRNKFFSKRRITIVIVLLFMLSLGIGYAILVSDLNMNGTISMKEYNAPTLYNVLKKEAVEGGLAREYTGEHHDSFTEEPSKKIYHYYSNSNIDSNKITQYSLDFYDVYEKSFSPIGGVWTFKTSFSKFKKAIISDLSIKICEFTASIYEFFPGFKNCPIFSPNIKPILSAIFPTLFLHIAQRFRIPQKACLLSFVH